MRVIFFTLIFSLSLAVLSFSQPKNQSVLTLKEALDLAQQNYGSIKAKQRYAEASKAAVDFSRSEYLPNFTLSGQWDYGTVNGQIGPAYGFGGFGVASSGLPAPSQNWNAAFGAIYLTNVNWEFFAFGKFRERIGVADKISRRDEMDLEQESFQHRIKVTAAYLNLLVAQRLLTTYEKNLIRAEAIGQVVTTRARTGLIAGVDSSLANAEISNARIAIIRARDFELEQQNNLAVLMGVAPQSAKLDTVFLSRLPLHIGQLSAHQPATYHPTLQLFRSRIDVSDQQSKYFRTLYLPSFSLVGIFQTRGSGFGSTYASNQSDFSQSLWRGFNPVRSNYLFGLGMTWNLTQSMRYTHQIRSQNLIGQGLQEEYNLAKQQLNAQAALAENKIKNALEMFRESPVQVKAASDAYLQKSVLYKNGLTNLVDLNQTLYALIRAESDREIAQNNVWQALLLKAAAVGDYSLFENEL